MGKKQAKGLEPVEFTAGDNMTFSIQVDDDSPLAAISLTLHLSPDDGGPDRLLLRQPYLHRPKSTPDRVYEIVYKIPDTTPSGTVRIAGITVADIHENVASYLGDALGDLVDPPVFRVRAKPGVDVTPPRLLKVKVERKKPGR
ncbi:MAG: hypothetical protein HY335_08355 [Deinococcus sp.]|nr:hypothetical protein [Deinococcus sp.]